MDYKFNYQKVRINKKDYYKLYVYVNHHGKTTKLSDATKICWHFFKDLNTDLSKEFVSNMKEAGVNLNSSNKLLNNCFLFNTKLQCKKAITAFDSYIMVQKFLVCGGQ